MQTGPVLFAGRSGHSVFVRMDIDSDLPLHQAGTDMGAPGADDSGQTARHRFVPPVACSYKSTKTSPANLEWQQQQLGDAREHSLDQVIDDDILRLIFTACHPVLTAEARITFTLHLIFAE